MKKLICSKDVELLHKQGKKKLHVDSNTLITPSARDAAKAYEIEIRVHTSPCVEEVAEVGKTCGDGLDPNMIYTVLKSMADRGLLQGVLDSCSEKPYVAESDCGGLKVVRGNTVKMDVFDTGNPNAKAYYQELISKDESQISAGFLVIDHSNFEWELTYEEIDYVIEGTLTITINGRTFTAYPGDVLFVPAGSKVVWGSPDKARVFYATYPANWADLL